MNYQKTMFQIQIGIIVLLFIEGIVFFVTNRIIETIISFGIGLYLLFPLMKIKFPSIKSILGVKIYD